MTDPLIESVARAAYAAEWEGDFPSPGSIQHELAMNIARAAILATLEGLRDRVDHTEGFVVAFERESGFSYTGSICVGLIGVFDTLIAELESPCDT